MSQLKIHRALTVSGEYCETANFPGVRLIIRPSLLVKLPDFVTRGEKIGMAFCIMRLFCRPLCL